MGKKFVGTVRPMTNGRLGPADRLAVLIDRLEGYAVRLERAHDSRCVFTRIYAWC
jgi:hypothetical protein